MENIRKASILAVDDSTTNIALLEGILKEEGYIVETASNGKQALQMIEKRKPDLILLDLMMPRINGFKLLEKLKEDEECRNIPVFVVSARTNTKSIRKAMDLGADDFFKKPLDINVLLEKVKQLTSRKLDKE